MTYISSPPYHRASNDLLKDPILGDEISLDGSISTEDDRLTEGSRSFFSTEDPETIPTSSRRADDNHKSFPNAREKPICSWGEWDVPSGRAQEFREFLGNTRFRRIVDQHRPAYLYTPRKSEKTAISLAVHGIITNNGGRFLDKDKTANIWIEIPCEKALAKISQALRNGTRPVRSRGVVMENPALETPITWKLRDLKHKPEYFLPASAGYVAPPQIDELLVGWDGSCIFGKCAPVHCSFDHEFVFSVGSDFDCIDEDLENAMLSLINSL